MTFYLPTASKVVICIEGIELDLAFRLDWKEAEPRIPIYGYNDREYTKTVSGRRLVQGFLVMNFIAPYYLTSFLMRKEVERRKKQRQEDEEILNELLAGAETDSDKASRAKAIANELFKQEQESFAMALLPTEDSSTLLSPKSSRLKNLRRLDTIASSNKKLKNQLINSFIGGRDDGLKGRQLPMYTALDWKRPFNMEIYPTDPSFAQWYIVLEDVEITDVSQTINSSGANGSSEPLYETYSFLAKRRTVLPSRNGRQNR